MTMTAPLAQRALQTLALAAALCALSGTAHAHRAWLMPSATVLSGQEPWVTVDAAISNDVFQFEHQPMRLDALVITAPDGSSGKAENTSTGRFRSSFDVKLAQPGTWKIAMVADTLFASWKVGSETRRARGTAESLAKEIPADAAELSVSRNLSRNEIFVTAGKPSTGVLQPTGRGIELQALTHPNDLVAGEPARLRFLLDGQPAPGLAVTVVPSGIRYRNQAREIELATDAKGEVSITWPQAGLFWLSAAPARDTAGARPTGGTLAQPVRRATYAATFEVLPQ